MNDDDNKTAKLPYKKAHGQNDQETHKKGAQQVQYAERIAEALEYRKAGLSYRKIAEKVGWKSHHSARRAVEKGIAAIITKPARELIALENSRLDTAQVAIWNKVVRGELTAVDRLIKIMERRAKLNGLDAPRGSTTISRIRKT